MSRQQAIVLETDVPGLFRIRVTTPARSFIAAPGKGVPADARLPYMLRVKVVDSLGDTQDEMHDVLGEHRVEDGHITFVPRFPFDPGTLYRASFDPNGLPGAAGTGSSSLEFSLQRAPGGLPVVEQTFPTGDCLPENLLRFYVCFSKAMQRGSAADQIAVLGPGGDLISEVLYRAPVELWDQSMTRLTVLLDPGRLKRGVGPNRALGPPLLRNHEYTLAIGKGMTDISGRQLQAPSLKRFRVAEPVRDRVSVEQWQVGIPSAHTREPLVLSFPRAMDWALLTHSLSVILGEETIDGVVEVGPHEKSWIFTPALAWAPGAYRVKVEPSLEDICGNDIFAAFDRPLTSIGDLVSTNVSASISFRLG